MTDQLRHVLGGHQMSLIAIGGAIGTGLFLGSGFAIQLAGPSVLISFGLGAMIALFLMGALAEMTIMRPRAGNFGSFAAAYVSPLSGALVSYAYLAANLLAIGTEGTAVALCMRFWVPQVPAWWWIAISAVGLIGVNAFTVRAFGVIESSFSVIKIAAIIAFIALASLLVARTHALPSLGQVAEGGTRGLFPHGIAGTWMAVVVALFSFMSVELIAITAAEARNPGAAVVTALRLTFVRLTIFYLLTIGLILLVNSRLHVGSASSPFVMVMQEVGLPGAGSTMNFVVLTAALSSMNSQLYGASRTMFGLGTSGDGPRWLAKVNRNGVPVRALGLAATGMFVAIGVNAAYPNDALGIMIALAVFGALFTWLMIFVSHIRFRATTDVTGMPFHAPGAPYTSMAGAALVAGVLMTTLFMPAFRLTLICGVPFLFAAALLHRRAEEPRRAVLPQSED